MRVVERRLRRNPFGCLLLLYRATYYSMYQVCSQLCFFFFSIVDGKVVFGSTVEPVQLFRAGCCVEIRRFRCLGTEIVAEL